MFVSPKYVELFDAVPAWDGLFPLENTISLIIPVSSLLCSTVDATGMKSIGKGSGFVLYFVQGLAREEHLQLIVQK